MIRKLCINNRGLTAIEILVCFSIVVVIVMSMFKVVNNQRDKQVIESYKNSITTYKNSVTKTIEEDIRNNGGIKQVIKIDDDTDGDSSDISNNNTVKVEIQFQLRKGGVKRKLTIYKRYNCDEDYSDKCEDNNYIEYNYQDSSNTKEVFKIPNIYNLRFNLIDVSKVGKDGEYLKIYVEFIHPDLGTKYSALNLIHPINSDIF